MEKSLSPSLQNGSEQHSGAASQLRSPRWIPGALLIAVAIILALVAYSSPWWAVTLEASSMDERSKVQFGLDSVTYDEYEGGNRTTKSYSELGKEFEPVREVFHVTALLVILSILFGIVSLVVGMVGGIRGLPGRVAVATGIIAAMLFLLPPIYFYFALPPVAENVGYLPTFGDDFPLPNCFAGTKTTSNAHTLTSTWGPDLGWFLLFIAFVFAITGASLVGKREKRPLGADDLPVESCTVKDVAVLQEIPQKAEQ